MYIINNVRKKAIAAVGVLLLSTACQSDWRDGINPIEEAYKTTPLAFTGTVASSQMPTRSDGSIVNLGETSLPETRERTYWRYNPTSGGVEEQKATYYAGIFGAYTGQQKWEDLVKKTTLTDDEKEAYSANLMYNVPAIINSDGTLEYSPYRFWPNNKLTAGTEHEYCTFWAYYPYNATAHPGDYGISIVESEIGEGKGMGKVHFTMHPDAAQQNDFMISMPVVDCNRDKYPIVATGDATANSYIPTPVPFRFYHMLAQVRLYAFIRGTDKLVYKENEYYTTSQTYTDAWGKGFTVTAEESGKIPVIDEEKSIRWYRTDFLDIRGEKKRADIHYKLEFNNIKTSADFFPKYDDQGNFSGLGYTEAQTLGSATVNHFIMNPYWFRFDDSDKKDLHRYMLNDKYMFGYFEETPVYKRENATTANGGLDGIDWSDSKWGALYSGSAGSYTTTPLHYLDLTGTDWTREKELGVPGTETTTGTGPYFSKHYNYCPGNILMVVPQVLTDEQVPHIVLTATGNKAVWDGSQWTKGEEITARITINMLKMGIKWESGYIYCYAIIDELHPGDDIVRGPESITTVFDTSKKWTDQW